MSTQPAPRPSGHDVVTTLRQRREPLWRTVVGDVLRGERLRQGRTLKDVSEAARISMPYLSEIERGLKEASSEVLAAAAGALGLELLDLLDLAHRDLALLRGPRPVPVTSARDLSAEGTTTDQTDDPYAAVQLGSWVELGSAREVGSRHTGPVVCLAA